MAHNPQDHTNQFTHRWLLLNFYMIDFIRCHVSGVKSIDLDSCNLCHIILSKISISLTSCNYCCRYYVARNVSGKCDRDFCTQDACDNPSLIKRFELGNWIWNAKVSTLINFHVLPVCVVYINSGVSIAIFWMLFGRWWQLQKEICIEKLFLGLCHHSFVVRSEANQTSSK